MLEKERESRNALTFQIIKKKVVKLFHNLFCRYVWHDVWYLHIYSLGLEVVHMWDDSFDTT